MPTTEQMTVSDAIQRLKQLVPGDPILYGELTRALGKADIDFEARGIYHDSVGFLERWLIDGDEIVVIDGMSSHVMVRTIVSDNLENLELEG
jgi:hypothetical protein